MGVIPLRKTHCTIFWPGQSTIHQEASLPWLSAVLGVRVSWPRLPRYPALIYGLSHCPTPRLSSEICWKLLRLTTTKDAALSFCSLPTVLVSFWISVSLFYFCHHSLFSFDPSRHPLIHFYPLIDMPFDIYLFTLQTGTTCFSSDSPHWLHPPQNTPLSSITAANLLSPLSSPVSLPLLFSSPYSATERILCWSVFFRFLDQISRLNQSD